MEQDALIYDWNAIGDFNWATARFDLNDESLRDGLQSPSAIDPPTTSPSRVAATMYVGSL